MIYKANFKLIIKTLCCISIFFIVYKKVNFKFLVEILIHSNPVCLLSAFVFLILAQIVSAFRMKCYFEGANVRMSRWFAIKLFFLSMYYNILLPGGIGGDGYKIYMMERLYKLSKLTSLKLALANRFNGLAAIIGLLAMMFKFNNNICKVSNFNGFLSVLFLSFFVSYAIFVKFVSKEKIIILFKASLHSLVLQVFGLIAALLILNGITAEILMFNNILSYLMLFLFSSILASLPISIGGVGVREASFVLGAQYFDVNVEIGTAFAFMYFVINFAVAIIGGLFINSINKEALLNDNNLKL